jgi:hypothetical protein
VVRARARNAFPWTPELVALLGKHPDRVVAERAGIAEATVAAERRRRGIEAFEPKRGPFDWTAERIAALGTDTDVNVAARLEACVSTVVRKRLILGIPAFHPRQYHGPQGHLWSPQELALLGTMSDADVGKEVGLSSSAVNMKRLSLGIPAFKPAAPRVDWSEGKLAS